MLDNWLAWSFLMCYVDDQVLMNIEDLKVNLNFDLQTGYEYLTAIIHEQCHRIEVKGQKV